MFFNLQGKFIRIHFGPSGKLAGADIETCECRWFIKYFFSTIIIITLRNFDLVYLGNRQTGRQILIKFFYTKIVDLMKYSNEQSALKIFLSIQKLRY